MANAHVRLPLAGIRVVELGHVVMGACCSLVLADMGAEVIKVERPPYGDETRRYKGFGTGLFHFFNRNKTSLPLDLKTAEGREVLRRVLAGADVFIENFAPGAVDRLGFDYDTCRSFNERLVYCSLKGFMPGPYENRPSLDNLVQMMGGLAYMTGPSGRPLRAGASVTDILGGTFGALGIIAALRERDATGKGQKVTATLFEAVAFMVGQHMAGAAISGEALRPMPESANPWAIYDLFTTADGERLCIGIVSDKQWLSFSSVFGLDTARQGIATETNADRLRCRDLLLSAIQEKVGSMELDEASRMCERAAVPFAPVRRPDELFDDPHLLASGGLVETRLPDDRMLRLPKLPMRMGDRSFALRRESPMLGEGSEEILLQLGYSEAEIRRLREAGALGGAAPPAA